MDDTSSPLPPTIIHFLFFLNNRFSAGSWGSLETKTTFPLEEEGEEEEEEEGGGGGEEEEEEERKKKTTFPSFPCG